MIQLSASQDEHLRNRDIFDFTFAIRELEAGEFGPYEYITLFVQQFNGPEFHPVLVDYGSG